MPWITARTWISGELVTAFLMNQQIRDNSNVLKTSISDTGYLQLANASVSTSSLEIDGDNAIAPIGNYHLVSADGASTQLDTIPEPESGVPNLLILVYDAGITVTQDGNITVLGAELEAVGGEHSLFKWDPSFELWIEVFRSATGSGGNSTPFLFLPPVAFNEGPSSAYATFDTRNGHTVLDFDGSTDEEKVAKGVLPPGYTGGDLEVTVLVAFTSATSGTSRWQAAFERVQLGTLDIDADSFDSFQSNGVAAPGTSGDVVACTITFTSSQIDGLLAGEPFRLKIRRDPDGTSGTDDITTDAEVWGVTVREV